MTQVSAWPRFWDYRYHLFPIGGGDSVIASGLIGVILDGHAAAAVG
jgi:hypothetical protein